jgi:hypothetical protein
MKDRRHDLYGFEKKYNNEKLFRMCQKNWEDKKFCSDGCPIITK